MYVWRGREGGREEEGGGREGRGREGRGREGGRERGMEGEREREGGGERGRESLFFEGIKIHAFKISKEIFFCLQSSDEELEEFEVELRKSTGRGLGITIAGLANINTGGMYRGTRVCRSGGCQSGG